jgi:DNA-directed RNA polymerase sigma subunit (sigma70/sigma32)
MSTIPCVPSNPNRIPCAGMAEGTDPFAPYLAAIEDALEAAEQFVKQAGGVERFHYASQLREFVEPLHEREAKLRAQMAAAIRDDERLTLTKLAKRISVGRARAAQFVSAAREDDKDGE